MIKTIFDMAIICASTKTKQITISKCSNCKTIEKLENRR